MLVRCPSCGHSRHINPDKIPPRAEFATCPKCSHRFRFRALDPLPAQDAREEAAPPVAAPEEHKDIWDAVDSLHERWKENKDGEREHGADEEDDRPLRDLGRLDDYAPEENTGWDRTPGVFIPWEKPRELGFAVSFYRTFLMVLLYPSRFFASLTPNPPLAQSLLFAILFGMLQTCFDTVWGYLAVNSAAMEPLLTDALGPAMYQAMVQATDISRLPFLVLTAPLKLALNLFITSGLVHLMLRVAAPEQANFVKTFKVAAYASAAMIFIMVPFLGSLLASIAYLFFILLGCRIAFRLPWSRAMLVVIPPLILVPLLFIGQISASL